ncbi:hypothetical protein HPB48_016413 [Haemaphysalis longicornis]|uniref:Uncharacterized protein n=1 Tax=Haemaphysalis longicornis TaxID=44386 RepID=A0A9J6FB28_HAELO|nr:hypothetical protein HPB48_016413 [Haemaphysalis longicornis]
MGEDNSPEEITAESGWKIAGECRSRPPTAGQARHPTSDLTLPPASTGAPAFTNTDPDHPCPPKCSLCGGAHLTTEKDCRARYNTPYVVRKRLWECQKANIKLWQQDFPPLRPGATKSRGRRRKHSSTASRSGSKTPSPADKVSWVDAVFGAVRKGDEAATGGIRTSHLNQHGQRYFRDNHVAVDCRRFANKKAVLHQHIRHAARKPAVILLQETLIAAPTLRGYREHVCPIESRGLCTLVRKGLTFSSTTNSAAFK